MLNHHTRISVGSMSSLQYSGPSTVYKELSELPVLTSVQFLQSNTTTSEHSAPTFSTDTNLNPVIQGNYLVRDHDHKTQHLIAKTFTLSRPEHAQIGFEPTLSTTTAVSATDVRASAMSRSGKHRAILREYVDGNIRTTRRVEIWSDLRLVASLDVSKTHGPFLTDGNPFFLPLITHSLMVITKRYSTHSHFHHRRRPSSTPQKLIQRPRSTLARTRI